jgi:hypothetical protein
MKTSFIIPVGMLAVSVLVLSYAFAADRPTVAPVAEGKPFPIYKERLRGSNIFRVINPCESEVTVALRSGTKGITFGVPPSEASAVPIPEGAFDVYLLYADRPAAAFKGDPIRVDGHLIELLLSAKKRGGYSRLEKFYPFNAR